VTTDFQPFGRSSRRSRILGAALFVVALGGAIAVVMRSRPAPPPAAAAGHDHAARGAAGGDSLRPVALSPAAARRIGVTFAEASLGPIAREIRVVAQVTYDETRVTTIAPKLEGWVERLHVNVTGQPVRRGQPLFSLYAPMAVTTQQELLLARRLGGQVAGGSADARSGARTLAESARQRLLAWDVPPEEIDAVERDGIARRTVTLRSPVSGTVIERSVSQGQRIMPGEAIYRIADLSRVWIEGEVFERDLSAARPGQRVEVELPALPGSRRAGRIGYVYPTLDPATRTARIRVELANPGLGLKPGMLATIRFTEETAPALSVPRAAVLVTGERALAFVKRPDGAFEPRPVTLGRATDDRLEILRGLEPGDSVVASATFLVDAESNLGTNLGGMGDMPGMDIRPPAPAEPGPGGRDGGQPRSDGGQPRGDDGHAGQGH
jgi:Cu(I)/Ag(I) efflux system membrane fusion protein